MISVLISSESRYKVNRRKLRQAVAETLEGKGLDKAEVSLLVVGTRKIKTLNRDFRKVDEETDVLSFPQEGSRSPEGILYLGDIVICYPVARQEAARENKMLDDKIAELVEHGLNHLLGIHHHDDNDE